MTAGQALADGAAGLALGYLATGQTAAAYAALTQATAAGVSIDGGASLFYGAPALAFVLATSDDTALDRARQVTAAATATVTHRRLDAAHRRIDQRQRPPYAEYDLIRGLTGLGVALRAVGDADALREVLTYLVRLTEPFGGLPGWWCSHPPTPRSPGPAGGHSNHGIAHGIAGPLALLALTARDGITVAGQTGAMLRICRWLDTWQQRHHGGAWWPQTLTLDELRRDRPQQATPWRPSWCYGTPGVARSQQLAAIALRDPFRQQLAEEALAACVADPDQIARLSERGLCHGTAGLLAVTRRMAVDALVALPIDTVQRLHRPAVESEPAGFLDGTGGASLAAAATPGTWDTCLLLT